MNHTTKTIVEVKPKEMLLNTKTEAKIAAAIEWGNSKGYNFV